jgi:hypothetical protein
MVNRPPLLDGSNYDFWKSRMAAFFKSIDSKTWKAVLRGWKPPVVLDKDENKIVVLKPEDEWSKEDDELALGNNKALNALFNGVDKSMFKLIKPCIVAKDAWKILETAHKGTSKVKMSRLQLLTTKFENLIMKEDKSIHEFHLSFLDIANSFEVLGEKMCDEKLARKILRSLPKRFDMKVTTIEEAQDIATIKVEELIGSLLTCEIAINERTDKKAKSIAFVTNANSEESQANVDTEESITDALVLLGRQFNKVMKCVDRRQIPNEQNIRFDIHKQQTNLKKTRTDEKNSQPNDVDQCHECEGYGHIRPECATILRRQKKGLVVSWSDSDSSEEGDGESTKHVTALT